MPKHVAITIATRIYTSDATGYLPYINESISLDESFKLITPSISLPEQVVWYLRSARTQNYYQLMQRASINVQRIRSVDVDMYVLSDDIISVADAIRSMLDLMNEFIRWDNSTLSTYASSAKFDAEMSLLTVPTPSAGDILDVEWHNAMVDAIKKIVDIVRMYMPTRLGPETKSLLRKKKPEDIVEPDDHNNKRDVLVNALNAVYRGISGIVVVLLTRK